MHKKITGLALSVLFFVLSFPATAQQSTKVALLEFLLTGNAASTCARAEAIRLALRERGYIVGQNIAIEYRHAQGEARSAP